MPRSRPTSVRYSVGGEVRVEIRLFRDVADLLLVGERILGQRTAVERDRSRARLEQADDDVDRGALAGAVRAEIADDLAALQLEADLVEREQPAVALRQRLALPAWRSAPVALGTRAGEPEREHDRGDDDQQHDAGQQHQRHHVAIVRGRPAPAAAACGSTLAATWRAATRRPASRPPAPASRCAATGRQRRSRGRRRGAAQSDRAVDGAGRFAALPSTCASTSRAISAENSRRNAGG